MTKNNPARSPEGKTEEFDPPLEQLLTKYQEVYRRFSDDEKFIYITLRVP